MKTRNFKLKTIEKVFTNKLLIKKKKLEKNGKQNILNPFKTVINLYYNNNYIKMFKLISLINFYNQKLQKKLYFYYIKELKLSLK